MIIAVDFDGTCVTHEFPKIGKDIGTIPVLKSLVDKGHKLILYTMRSTKDAGGGNIDANGNELKTNVLQDAVNWFNDNNIPLYGINKNPGQSSWTSSPKVFAHMYIDDMALGCPLIYNPNISNNPFVNWESIIKYLYEINIFNIDESNELIKQVRQILKRYE